MKIYIYFSTFFFIWWWVCDGYGQSDEVPSLLSVKYTIGYIYNDVLATNTTAPTSRLDDVDRDRSHDLLTELLNLEELLQDIEEKNYLKNIHLDRRVKGVERLFFLIDNRAEYTATNVLSPNRFLEYAAYDSYKGRSEDPAMWDVKRIFRRGLTLGARQYGLEYIGEAEWIDQIIPNFVTKTSRSILTGFEERHQLVSPFHREEGIPGGNGENGGGYVKAGIRPFRQSNPYGFLTYKARDSVGTQIADLHLRAYMEEWGDITEWNNVRFEFIADVPIAPDIEAVAGLHMRPGFANITEDGTGKFLNASVGVRMKFDSGFLYFGGGHPESGIVIMSFTW